LPTLRPEPDEGMKSKLYNVTGVAFVPIRVLIQVWADTEDEAKAEALEAWNVGDRKDRHAMMIDNSEDHSAAWGFEPSEAAIEL
jgi:hypothetical protein